MVKKAKKSKFERKKIFMNLDLELESLRELLYHASDIVVRLYADFDNKRIFHGKSPAEVRALFEEPLPREPQDVRSLLESVERDVFSGATLNISPHFLAYVMSGANHVGILAELLGAALNQNCTKWHLAASAAEIEQQVIRWIAEFISYPSDAGGVLVSGGSVANLTCLAVARKVKAPFDVSKDGVRAGPPLTVYVSEEVHSCIDKGIDMLGLGKDQLRKIPVNDDFTINEEKLEAQIMEDKSSGYFPICVIGNGGTINSGAVDPLETLADICAKHDLWFHVDAAYGGPAAATEIAHDLFRGIDRADSVVLDLHKWLYVPFEAACVLVKHRQDLRDTFSILPDYLRFDVDKSERVDFMEYSFQLSRNFKALKVWMTFKGYGTERLRATIQENIKTMRYLADLIDQSDDFERLAPVPLSAVCFRYRTEDAQYHHDEAYLSSLNKKLLDAVEKDGRVFITGTMIRGKTALRACCVNHRTQPSHVEYLLSVLRELG
ncbi:MAG: pyridoxal phosphate-dependent decarboxylase family protein, partial [Candidatus Bipolaricaulia bacterium]